MARVGVYLETSVIGYLASRPSRDLVVAGHQQITREWFAQHADKYELLISMLVVREASAGDTDVAHRRGAILNELPRLAVTDQAGRLAGQLVASGAVPKKAAEDALHIAVAAVHGVEFLLTWNCKHIANAAMRHAIEQVCRREGYEPPVICTPEELMNDETS